MKAPPDTPEDTGGTTPASPLDLSDDDRRFLCEFEAGAVAPAAFDHRAHVRLAYIYLTDAGPETAYERMRRALHAFLDRHGIDRAKYHDTMTRAWVMAVNHFMQRTPEARSADEFIDRNPRLLDSKIMLSHYSASVLFSDEARARFIDPDLEPIPPNKDVP